MSTLTHPLQNISGKQHDRRLRRPRRHCQLYFRFADDIDGLAGEEEKLANLVECLDKASTAYGMEISAEETKLMTKTPVASAKRSN